VENSIVDGVWFFVIGMCGSAIQLFVFLLISGDVQIIRNNVIRDIRVMASLFIIVGGSVTLVYALSFQITLLASEVWKILVMGIGWQGLIGSYLIVKKAGEGEKSPKLRDMIEELKQTNNELQQKLMYYMQRES
jgi:hypothetical protein